MDKNSKSYGITWSLKWLKKFSKIFSPLTLIINLLRLIHETSPPGGGGERWTGMVKKELRKSVSRRLATIKGHIGGIEKMVEEEKDCDEILFQLGAVNGSLNKLIVHILESYMTECLVEAEINDLKMLEKMKELTRTMAGILKR